MDGKITLLNTDFDARFETNPSGCNIPVFSYHEHYEIYILTSGTRTMIINDKMFAAKPSTAAMIPSNALHRSFGNTPYSGFCFHFTPEFLNTYFSPEAQKQLLQCFNSPVISIDEACMQRLSSIAASLTEYGSRRFVCLCEALDILYAQMLNMRQEDADRINISRSCTANKISAVTEYINTNFLRLNSENELCERFGISRGYLCRSFKKQTGMTVRQYINTLKINYACHFLADSNSPNTIAYIANECGFDSSSYFIRVFKKLMGLTPSAYRDKITDKE